jgi:hypothetical protein
VQGISILKSLGSGNTRSRVDLYLKVVDKANSETLLTCGSVCSLAYDRAKRKSGDSNMMGAVLFGLMLCGALLWLLT